MSLARGGVLGLRVVGFRDVERVRVGRLNHDSVPGCVPELRVGVGEVDLGFDCGFGLGVDSGVGPQDGGRGGKIRDVRLDREDLRRGDGGWQRGGGGNVPPLGIGPSGPACGVEVVVGDVRDRVGDVFDRRAGGSGFPRVHRGVVEKGRARVGAERLGDWRDGRELGHDRAWANRWGRGLDRFDPGW